MAPYPVVRVLSAMFQVQGVDRCFGRVKAIQTQWIAEHHVYAYFASCGLYCFDHQGQQVWEYPLSVSKRFNGSGTSPILVDDKVILNRKDDREKFLVALDATTGKEIWKTQHGNRCGVIAEAFPKFPRRWWSATTST